jgi:hypothetical protein
VGNHDSYWQAPVADSGKADPLVSLPGDAGAPSPGQTLLFRLLAFPSLPEAPTSFLSFGSFHDVGEIGIDVCPSLLRESAEAIKLLRLEGVVFSERGQPANDLIEAGIDVQQVLVNWQLHALGPPAGSADGAAVAWVLPGSSTFDGMVETSRARQCRLASRS